MTTLILRWSFLFRKYCEIPLIFILGGIGYVIIELLWRGHSHWTMAICGGLCFLFIYLFEQKRADAFLWKKCLFGCLIITAVEFITGCTVNLFFKMNVWDYSNMPFNLLGQICIEYSFLWLLLSAPVFLAAKTVKKYIFPNNENQPSD